LPQLMGARSNPPEENGGTSHGKGLRDKATAGLSDVTYAEPRATGGSRNSEAPGRARRPEEAALTPGAFSSRRARSSMDRTTSGRSLQSPGAACSCTAVKLALDLDGHRLVLVTLVVNDQPCPGPRSVLRGGRPPPVARRIQ
jgi:hypothetical protein